MKLIPKIIFFSIFFLISSGYLHSIYGQDQHQGHKNVTFQGGSGGSVDDAIIISGAKNYVDGIAAEYIYLSSHFKKPDVDWKLIKQRVGRHKNKIYDLIQIQLSDGTKRDLYFDITKFYGKY
jgi:hypothetical protein